MGFLMGIPMLGASWMGGASVTLFYGYVLVFDFLRCLGHCNVEMMPVSLFDHMPVLRYLIYTPRWVLLWQQRLSELHFFILSFWETLHELGVWVRLSVLFGHDVEFTFGSKLWSSRQWWTGSCTVHNKWEVVHLSVSSLAVFSPPYVCWERIYLCCLYFLTCKELMNHPFVFLAVTIAFTTQTRAQTSVFLCHYMTPLVIPCTKVPGSSIGGSEVVGLLTFSEHEINIHIRASIDELSALKLQYLPKLFFVTLYSQCHERSRQTCHLMLNLNLKLIICAWQAKMWGFQTSSSSPTWLTCTLLHIRRLWSDLLARSHSEPIS